MGQHPSKDKLNRSSSERIHRERFASFGKKGEVLRKTRKTQRKTRISIFLKFLAKFGFCSRVVKETRSGSSDSSFNRFEIITKTCIAKC